MNKKFSSFLILLVTSILILAGCRGQLVAAGSSENLPSSVQEFTLMTSTVDGRMVYVGVGGDIDGLVNPDLFVSPNTHVQVKLVNGDGIAHDFSVPDFGAKTSLVSSQGKSVEVSFIVGENQSGIFSYFCSQPGHREAGQEGRLVVSQP